LEWIMSDSLRRTVHKGTTKIERHHKFAKHLAFGGHGLFRTNDPADQEKAIVYNELVANVVALQTVVDQTQALHALKSKGVPMVPPSGRCRPQPVRKNEPRPTPGLIRIG
jgi:TnpA family transposase